MGQQTITKAERERRERQRQQQEAASRTIFGQASTPVEIPGHGEVVLTYTNRTLAWAERQLTPLLDALPDRLRGKHVTPGGDPAHPDAPHAVFVEYANCWDALEVITTRFPMDALPILLIAGTRHAGMSEDELWDLPPYVTANEAFGEAVGEAVAVAFGQGVEDEDDGIHPPDGTAGDTPEA